MLSRMAFLLLVVLGSAAIAQISPAPAPPRTIEFKSADGILLKGTYFAAAKPGPGVLLVHQVNRTRKSWESVASQLAAAGINTLTFDSRGHGESSGTPFDELSHAEQSKNWRGWPADAEAALQFLIAQPGVHGNVIGIGGAGLLGVDNSVEAARHHATEIKSLALLSGETFRDGLTFLHQALQLPGLYVVSDLDEYPPTAEAMQLLYVTSSSPGKKFIHYSAANDAPWLWYEPFDLEKVAATGNHGTDLFQSHPELPGIIVHWFVTTLLETPGHAPADPIAAGPILNELAGAGGPAHVARELVEAREHDPKAQLFPEISASIVGFDFTRAGNARSALEVAKVVQMAYPDSADANDTLADDYLAVGEKELARQYAQKALALLNAPGVPASSWANTDQYRGEIHRDVEKVLTSVSGKP